MDKAQFTLLFDYADTHAIHEKPLERLIKWESRQSSGYDAVFFFKSNQNISISEVAVDFEMTSFNFKYPYIVIYLISLIWGHQIKYSMRHVYTYLNQVLVVYPNAIMTECPIFLSL